MDLSTRPVTLDENVPSCAPHIDSSIEMKIESGISVVREKVIRSVDQTGKIDPEALEGIGSVWRQRIAFELVRKDLPREVAVFRPKCSHEIVQSCYARSVVKDLEQFEGIDQQDLAETIIRQSDGRFVAEFLHKFDGLDHQDIADRLIAAGKSNGLVEFLENFQGLDHQQIAEKLIMRGRVDAERLAEHLHKFHDVDHRAIADRLIQCGYIDLVARHLEKFHRVDHQYVADRLLDEAEGSYYLTLVFDENLERFRGLSQATLDRFEQIRSLDM